MIRLMHISNDPKIGLILQKAGVDWIFIDLEYIGKKERQKNRNTVISAHTVDDIKEMRKVIATSKLLVRINPIGKWSESEINNVIVAGADIIMLPFFKTYEEVEKFLNLVNDRVETCLLLETVEAVNNVENILSLGGIDYIHIGLNDLHIQRKTTFMFEYLSDGSLDILIDKIKKFNIPYGFGGMGRLGKLIPPAEHILTEHYRLGSSGVILARSFLDKKYTSLKELEEYFIREVDNIRNYEKMLLKMDNNYFKNMKTVTNMEIKYVVNLLKEKNGK